MPSKQKLKITMSVAEFDHGYWYAVDIKRFAKEIGISFANRLRKDQLEKEIKNFLTTGKVAGSPKTFSKVKSNVKDLEKGLTANTKIINYTGNRQTKNFLLKIAKKLNPKFSPRSGCWYRLNRWRDHQLGKGKNITYGDLAKQLVFLCNQETEFKRIPHVRYINFIADYLKNEKSADRAKALKVWKKLKKMNIPKTYQSWKKS